MQSVRSPETSVLAPREHWIRRRWIRLVWFTAIILPTGYFLWMCFGWPAAIEISYETTRLTEPRTKDGRYINYLEFLRQQMGTAADAKYEDDLWALLTMPNDPRFAEKPKAAIEYVDPDTVIYGFGAVVLEQQQQVRQARLFGPGPFSAADDPELAKLVDQNAWWYNAISSVDPGPASVDFPVSQDETGLTLYDLGTPTGHVHREIASRLRLNARLQFGKGDPATGLATIELMMAVAERERQVPFLMSYIVEGAIDTMAYQVLWACVMASTDVPDALLLKILSLPIESGSNKTLADRYDFSERFIVLNQLQEAHRSRCMNFDGIFFSQPLIDWKAQWFCQRVDWNHVMRSHNRNVDQIVAAIRLKTFREQRKALEGIISERSPRLESITDDEFDVDSVRGLLFSDWTTFVEMWCLSEVFSGVKTVEWPGKMLNQQRASHLAARFVAHRQRHGTYPETLNALLHIEGLPAAPPDVTIDAFSDESFLYRRKGDGFVLYSIGPNLIDDSNGEEFTNSTNGRSDDMFWSWPLQHDTR